MSGRIATLTSSWNLAPIGELSCFPGLLSTFPGSDTKQVMLTKYMVVHCNNCR